jgi:hypothetical protein
LKPPPGYGAGTTGRWINLPVRRGTLEALATRLNTETDEMVRRGLKESIYDLLDENTGYLSAWVKASSKGRRQKPHQHRL